MKRSKNKIEFRDEDESIIIDSEIFFFNPQFYSLLKQLLTEKQYFESKLETLCEYPLAYFTGAPKLAELINELKHNGF